jgi:hypothetical protein
LAIGLSIATFDCRLSARICPNAIRNAIVNPQSQSPIPQSQPSIVNRKIGNRQSAIANPQPAIANPQPIRAVP